MSCNYAEGLSPYEDKGILGLPEKFEASESVEQKCTTLTEWILNARHVVIHTGAGISTSAGIPDFRGPKGVWTLEKKGIKPDINVSFNEAIPTATHMALKQLIDSGYAHYIVSQNIDGLHLRSGIQRKFIAELHGNMFTEQCSMCETQFVRKSATTTVGKKSLGTKCHRSSLNGRHCRGSLHDTILDWEDNLPEDDLTMADYHSNVADLCICLGTTLQIVPSGNLPLRTKKYGGRLVIVNLQPTKHDKKADLLINTYVDDVLVQLMKNLKLEIPIYSKSNDPTKTSDDIILDWTIKKSYIENIKKLYNLHCKNFKKRKLLELKEDNCIIKKRAGFKNECVVKKDNDKKTTKVDCNVKQESPSNSDDKSIIVKQDSNKETPTGNFNITQESVLISDNQCIVKQDDDNVTEKADSNINQELDEPMMIAQHQSEIILL